MDFHGTFGKPEIAADQFVRLALHEQLQHVRLAECETELRWLGHGSGTHAVEAVGFGWHVDTTGEHQSHGTQKQLRVGRLGDESHRAHVERGLDRRAIVCCRQHQHRNPRPVAAQFTQEIESIATRQREIEQDQV